MYPRQLNLHPSIAPPIIMLSMTWANGLTALRLLAAPLSGWSVATAQWRLALLLFVIAVATDLLDGIAARHLGQVSRAGGFFDHATDCLFVTLTVAGLAVTGWAPWVLVLLIPAAFVQYTLDSGALAGRALRTNAIGKSNGVGYFILVGAVIARETLDIAWLPASLLRVFAWLLVTTTLVSMGERLLYLVRARRSPR